MLDKYTAKETDFKGMFPPIDTTNFDDPELFAFTDAKDDFNPAEEDEIMEEMGITEAEKTEEANNVEDTDRSYIQDYYSRVMRNIPLLTEEEELYWAKLAKKGDKEAKNKLVEHNIRYVLKLATKYNTTSMTYDDIVQEGVMGLMMAADRFDYTKGYRFTTYATWWIRQKITRSIYDNDRSIRIPVHVQEELNQLKKAEREMEQQSLKGRQQLEWLCKRTGFSESKISELQRYRQDPVSLDTPIIRNGDDADSCMSDFVADENSILPEDTAINSNIKILVRTTMDKCLTDREKAMLTCRFGLNGGSPMTLEEVGKIFHVTRERVRQVECTALRKMKNPKYKLRDVL